MLLFWASEFEESELSLQTLTFFNKFKEDSIKPSFQQNPFWTILTEDLASQLRSWKIDSVYIVRSWVGPKEKNGGSRFCSQTYLCRNCLTKLASPRLSWRIFSEVISKQAASRNYNPKCPFTFWAFGL